MSVFVEVPLKVLRSQHLTTFPLHARIDQSYIRFLGPGEVLSDSRRRMVEHSEPPALWLHPDHLPEYAAYLAESLSGALDEDRSLGPDRKVGGSEKCAFEGCLRL